MNKKYFFFDIDGTLLRYNQGNVFFPKSTKLAIQKLHEQGHFIAIATGRSYPLAKPTMDLLDIHHMVSDGGNGITINDELIDVMPLDHKKCVELIEECNKKGYAWGIAPEISNRRFVPNLRFFELTNSVYMKDIVIENLDLNDYEKIYKVFIACLPEEEKQLEKTKGLPCYRYTKEFFTIEPMDKMVGISRMMKHLGASLKDMVVFGDGENDCTMFSDQWISIAMGNACDLLKEKATFVTKTLEEDGVYYACKHFGWIE